MDLFPTGLFGTYLSGEWGESNPLVCLGSRLRLKTRLFEPGTVLVYVGWPISELDTVLLLGEVLKSD